MEWLNLERESALNLISTVRLVGVCVIRASAFDMRIVAYGLVWPFAEPLQCGTVAEFLSDSVKAAARDLRDALIKRADHTKLQNSLRKELLLQCDSSLSDGGFRFNRPHFDTLIRS